MLAAMSSGLPPRNSARESFLQLFFLQKDQIDYMRDLAHAQLAIDEKKGLERFMEFQKAMFPWMTTAMKREKDAYREALLKEIAKGGLRVTAPGKPQIKRRMQATRSNEDSDRIYRRLAKK